MSTSRLPFHVRRILSRYAPAFRMRVEELLKERIRVLGRDPRTWDDLHPCIDQAFDELHRPRDEEADCVEADPAIAALAEKQVLDGHFLTTEDYLDEIRSKMAGHRSGADQLSPA